MPTPLPDRPNLDQLKNQAKDLLKGHNARDPEALRRIQANHPRLGASSAHEIQASRVTLSGAQLVIAREYGFASWPKLKAHVESLAQVGTIPWINSNRPCAPTTLRVLGAYYKPTPC